MGYLLNKIELLGGITSHGPMTIMLYQNNLMQVRHAFILYKGDLRIVV